MVKIVSGKSRQVLDSRGNPTVEVTLRSSKHTASAIVPSGASTGIHEALELRDKKDAYGGKSVLKAVNNVNKKILPTLTKKDFSSQKDIDRFLLELDGTVNKAKLGENAILATSMAFNRLLALSKNISLYQQLANDFCTEKITLPIPFANVINGGVHAGNELEMQEFMIAPVKAKSFSHATQMVAETYHVLKNIIVKKYGKNAANVGDEGGFAPPISNAKQALDMLSKAIEEVGYQKELRFAMDPASSEYYNKKSNTYMQKKLTPAKMQAHYEQLIKSYPIVSLEDPFEQDDFESWKSFTKKNGKKLQIVGDDLTVTNPTRVHLAADQKLCNALLLKINQIGSITESLTAASIAKDNKWKVMVSHRSGETEDAYIADLSTGLGMGQIKIGAPCRSDRVAKYNRLLRIEEELGKKAKYSKF